MAYCLLGIFSINMPLLYGEGKQAFIRLQEAILQRVYDDQSIFAWDLGSKGFYNGLMLAESPAAFEGCGSIVPCRMGNYQPDISLTSKGIRLNLPILGRGALRAMLRCQREDDPFALLSVPVSLHLGDVCVRRGGKVEPMPHSVWDRIPPKTVYLSTHPLRRWAVRKLREQPCIKITASPRDFSIEQSSQSRVHDLQDGYMPPLHESIPPGARVPGQNGNCPHTICSVYLTCNKLKPEFPSFMQH